MAHTPGPWEAICIVGIGWGVFGLRGEDGERCPIYDTLGSVGAADAHLIATSPNMLALCRDLYAEVGKGSDLGLGLAIAGYAERLRVLIEKAEGD